MALPDRNQSSIAHRGPRRAEASDPLQLLTDAALAHGDISAIFPDVLSALREVFRADTALLLVADDRSRNLAVAAVTGVLDHDLPVGTRLPVAEGVAARLTRERPRITLETFAGPEAVSEVVRGLVRSRVGAAMIVDSRLLGSLHLGWLGERAISDEDFQELQGFADRMALALDHARLYRAERNARSDAARAERRFRDLVHNLDAIVWEANTEDWRFTFVSRRAEKILGYPVQEWLDTPDFWLKIVHPEDREELLRKRRESVEKGRGGTLEYRVRSVDGRTVWVRGMYEVVRDLAGVPRQLRGLMLDITQRRHAEEDALRLAAIVENSGEAIIGKDLEGIILTWNQGAEKMYGYTAEEIVGQHISVLTPAKQRGQTEEIMAKVRAGERIEGLETQRRRKDGEIIDVALSISPIRDPRRRTVGASTIARDITSSKRAERTMRTTEKLAATGRLAASIAHEINNPLASVTNLLYLLQHDGKLEAHAAEYVKLAQEELQRVTHIVRQMLGFYRESESPVPVDLRNVVENVLLLYARRLQNTRIKVESSFRAEATIRGYPGEIRQVFSNLIVNSIEAMGDSGRIRISVRRSRDWANPEVEGVRVLIGDTGPGIPERARRHIFEPFFTTKGERGTGLGLWVSEGIVRKHGGSMRVRSNTGERHGTCFSLFFPFNSATLPRIA